MKGQWITRTVITTVATGEVTATAFVTVKGSEVEITNKWTKTDETSRQANTQKFRTRNCPESVVTSGVDEVVVTTNTFGIEVAEEFVFGTDWSSVGIQFN